MFYDAANDAMWLSVRGSRLVHAPGDGTRFRVCLPRHQAPVPASMAAAPPTNMRGHETLLICEDESTILEMLTSSFREHGYNVLAFDGPDQAVNFVAESNAPIDLLITDVVMPGLNVREMVERITDERPGLRALFLSGYTADVISQKGILDAGHDFLAKPFSPSDLLRKVRELLGGSTLTA